eukprot:5574724-Pyramimonas_sp.AAC.1
MRDTCVTQARHRCDTRSGLFHTRRYSVLQARFGPDAIVTVCSLSAHCLLTVCSHCLRTVCALSAHCLLTVCALSSHCLLTVCALSAHCLLTVCSLSAHCLRTVCALSAHCLRTVCSQVLGVGGSVRFGHDGRSSHPRAGAGAGRLP